MSEVLGANSYVGTSVFNICIASIVLLKMGGYSFSACSKFLVTCTIRLVEDNVECACCGAEK